MKCKKSKRNNKGHLKDASGGKFKALDEEYGKKLNNLEWKPKG